FKVTVTKVQPRDPILVIEPHRYDDTLSVRAGGSYNWDRPNGFIGVRGGVFYDTPAAPPQYTRLDFKAWEDIRVSAGIAYQWGNLMLAAGASYLFLPERRVSNSVLRQVDALGASSLDDLHSVTGNGVYNASYAILTAGLEWTFDPFR